MLSRLYLGRVKERIRKGKKRVGCDWYLWRWRAEGEEMFLHLKKPPPCREFSWDRQGASRPWRVVQQLVCGRQDRMRLINVVHVTALCNPV